VSSVRKPLQIKILDCKTYLHVVHEGAIDDMQTSLRCFKDSLEASIQFRNFNMLADLRKTEQDTLSATDRILFFESAIGIYHAACRHNEGKLRLAVLQIPEAKSNYTPGIDTAKDNGLACEIFYELEDALTWLASDSTAGPY
jgi:hypothetical protein